MPTRSLLSLLSGGATLAAAAGVHHCNESATDWTCYTVSNEPGEPTTVAGLATRLHTSPAKLVDYNMLTDDTTAPIPAGTPLRVPRDSCAPRAGNWACYTVEGWETLDLIANSPSSFIRNSTLLREINQDVLYCTSPFSSACGDIVGNNLLPPGLQLRLPTYPCVPTLDTLCYTLDSPRTGLKDQTLADVATIFGTNVSTLLDLNENTLGYNYAENSTVVVSGMQLTVPRPNLKAPSPCAKSRDWDCYTVAAGDTLHNIGIALSKGPHYDSPEPRANWYLLCEVNGLGDCDNLEIGQVLAIPLRASDSTTGFHADCVDEPGVWYCRTVPDDAACDRQQPGTCGVSANLVTTALSPFGGGQYNTAVSMGQHFIQLNRDLLPRASTYITSFFVPGSTVRVPYNAFDCFPTADRDCVANGDARLSRYFDEAYFGPMTLSYFGQNGNRGYSSCKSSDAVPDDCSDFSILEVMPPLLALRPTADGQKRVPALSQLLTHATPAARALRRPCRCRGSLSFLLRARILRASTALSSPARRSTRRAPRPTSAQRAHSRRASTSATRWRSVTRLKPSATTSASGGRSSASSTK